MKRRYSGREIQREEAWMVLRRIDLSVNEGKEKVLTAFYAFLDRFGRFDILNGKLRQIYSQ